MQKTFYFLIVIFFIAPVQLKADTSSKDQIKFSLAIKKDDAGYHEEAFNLYKELANNGHVISQHNVGEMLYWGQGTSRDLNKAIFWYEKAAESGDDISQYKLGDIFYKAKDFEKAAHWYEKAALNNHVKSQEMIASLYMMGLGVEKDKEKGLIWFKEAAKNGNETAKEIVKVYE